MKIYAIYKGDKFLFVGNVRECARYFNVRKETIYFLNSPSYKKRVSRLRVNGEERNWKIAIAIEEEEKNE